jgi:membrane-bound serine protease (ClpP class)
VGALVLFNSPNVPDFQRVSIPLVVGTSLASGGMFFLILLFAIRAQREPVRMGQESLVGRVGLAQTALNPTGIVQLGGEQWSAELDPEEEGIPAGMPVRVVQVKGLRLVVRRAVGALPS